MCRGKFSFLIGIRTLHCPPAAAPTDPMLMHGPNDFKGDLLPKENAAPPQMEETTKQEWRTCLIFGIVMLS